MSYRCTDCDRQVDRDEVVVKDNGAEVHYATAPNERDIQVHYVEASES